MFQSKLVLAGSAIAACITLAPVDLLAQTSTGTTSGTVSGTTSSNLSADRLADTYSASFGTRDDARAAIEGLRAGKDVTQGGVTVSGTGTTMGYGNVNIALSLAKAQAGEDATTKGFLSALDQVMDMRASGLGWGQIAKDLGFNLGQVVSGAKSTHASSAKASADKTGKASSMADAGKANSQGRGAAGMGGAPGQGGGSGNAGGGGNAGGAGGGSGSGGGGAGGGGGGKK